jgi:probable blue pigment (indigoidine) exporter
MGTRAAPGAAAPGLLSLAGSVGSLITVVVVWGCGYLAIGAAVSPDGGFGPLWLSGSRLLVAGLVLLAWERSRGGALPDPRRWGPMAVAGLLAWGLGSGLQVLAQRTVSPGLAALVMGATPALTVALDAAVARTLPTTGQLGAVGLGFAGLALLVGAAPTGVGGGALLLLLAALAWSAATVWEARRPTPATPLVTAGGQMLAGGAGLSLLALVTGEPLPAPTALGWVSWAWLAFGCGALGFPLWLAVVRALPVHLTMTQPTLSPVVAVMLGWLVLGDALGPTTLLGMALALVGAFQAARLGHERSHAPAPTVFAPSWRRGA